MPTFLDLIFVLPEVGITDVPNAQTGKARPARVQRPNTWGAGKQRRGRNPGSWDSVPTRTHAATARGRNPGGRGSVPAGTCTAARAEVQRLQRQAWSLGHAEPADHPCARAGAPPPSGPRWLQPRLCPRWTKDPPEASRRRLYSRSPESQQQQARASLRERYLRSILAMVGHPVSFTLHEGVHVTAQFGATDLDVANFYVSQLQTPIGVQAEALLRCSDIISYTFKL